MNKEDQKVFCVGMWGHFLQCGHEGPGGIWMSVWVWIQKGDHNINKNSSLPSTRPNDLQTIHLVHKIPTKIKTHKSNCIAFLIQN